MTFPEQVATAGDLPPPLPPAPPSGFRDGLATLLGATTIAIWPPSLKYSVLPFVITLTLLAAFLWSGYAWWPGLGIRSAEEPGWWGYVQQAQAWLLSFGLALFGLFTGMILSIAVTEPMCGALGILDRLVLVQKEELAPQAPWHPPGGGAAIRRALKVLAVGLCIQIPAQGLAAGAFLLDLIPFVGPLLGLFLTVPSLLLASLAMAWNLSDYPFSLAGWGVRQRLAWLWLHRRAVVGLCLPLTLLSFFLAPLVLPVGVIGVSRLFLRTLPPADPSGT